MNIMRNDLIEKEVIIDKMKSDIIDLTTQVQFGKEF